MSDERAVAAARRERAAVRRLSVEDQRLVAAFTQLVGDLDSVIEEILAGELDIDDRRALADTFRDLAGDLDVMTVPGAVAAPHPVPPWPLRERSSGPPR